VSQISAPEHQQFFGLTVSANLTPGHGADQFRVWRVAALAPEIIQLLVALRAGGMVRRALHGAEGGDAIAMRAGLGLAGLEEFHPDAPAAIGGLQHALAEIEDARD